MMAQHTVQKSELAERTKHSVRGAEDTMDIVTSLMALLDSYAHLDASTQQENAVGIVRAINDLNEAVIARYSVVSVLDDLLGDGR